MYLSYPEGDGHAGAEGDVSTISAVPSSDDMLGVHALSIGSPGKVHIRRPFERRSKVLARELAAKAEAHPSPEAEPAEARSVGLYDTDVQPEQRDRRESTSGLRALVAVDPLSMPRWWGERGLRLGWDGCGSAATGIHARKAQSGQGAADPCDAPNDQER